MSNKFFTAVKKLKPSTEMWFQGEIETEEDFNKVKWSTGADETNTAILVDVCPHPELTWEKVNVEMTRLQTEHDAQDYARKRKAEYPTIEELVVALYDTDDKAAIEAKRAEIKLKYPKPGA